MIAEGKEPGCTGKKKTKTEAAEGQQILRKVRSLHDKMGFSLQVVCALPFRLNSNHATQLSTIVLLQIITF